MRSGNIIYTHKNIVRIKELSAEFNLPFEIVYGIYLIETTYRPAYYRVGEYIVVLLMLILSILFKRPVKNYTIGKYQIGIGTILCFFGFTNASFYTKEICNLTIFQALAIIKSFFWNYNSKIFAWRLRILLVNSNTHTNNYSKLARNIGYAYNGNMVYGLLLEDIIEYLYYNNVMEALN